MNVIAAERDGEALWLLRSTERTEKDKVLAWMYDNNNKHLNIYPITWPVPYRLVLDIQINFERERTVTDILRASAQINNSLLTCQPGGRGNIVSLSQ